MEYIADTAIARTEVANRLDGCRDMVVHESCQDLVVVNHERKELDDCRHTSKRQRMGGKQNGGNIFHGNSYVINISGEAAGGSFSFLNGKFPDATKSALENSPIEPTK